MDNFKKDSFHWVGPGGIKCYCCFAYHGEKEIFRRLTRHRNKINIEYEINDGIDEYYENKDENND